jgi:hypothetical protein
VFDWVDWIDLSYEPYNTSIYGKFLIGLSTSWSVSPINYDSRKNQFAQQYNDFKTLLQRLSKPTYYSKDAYSISNLFGMLTQNSQHFED